MLPEKFAPIPALLCILDPCELPEIEEEYGEKCKKCG